MLHIIAALFFPPKCVLCGKLLNKEETDLCQSCRANAPEYIKSRRNIPFVAGWTSVWYYKDMVRQSLHRYKFRNARSYADTYGRFLAMQLLKNGQDDFDILTWIPTGARRRAERGYDQVKLLADAVGKELGIRPTQVLKKIRNTPPQSSLTDAATRRANVLGAYRVTAPKRITGKRIILLDDIITTGATASECARELLTAGAKEVYCAAVAAASHDKK